MKFEKIVLKNFMRYKGENTIEFSCNPDKNVTVVLGDNTVGKTTIAQAFRFCLYGTILVEKGKKAQDYNFLNEDVLAIMDANSRASVSVELTITDSEKRYLLFREITYTRLMPQLISKELTKKVKMKISSLDNPQEEVDVAEAKVDEIVNELFPKNLSHYFLFDGEKWSDITVNGVKENIKESVHSLTGLSSMQAAIYHLKKMGSNSVIRKLQGKISGSGAIFDSLQEDIKKNEIRISEYEERLKVDEGNIAYYKKKCEEVEEYLEQNRDTEAMQREFKNLAIVKGSKKQEITANYKTLVNEFSDKAYMLFAVPMMKASIDLLKDAKVERRDIPHMHQSSIDYLIERGVCICGNCIKKSSKEYDALIKQRDYLPPADIGSILGEFEKTATKWSKKKEDIYSEIKEYAVNVSDCRRSYDDLVVKYEKMEQLMNENINFAEKRAELKKYEGEMRKYSLDMGETKGRIENCKSQIESLEKEIQTMAAKNRENQKWQKCVNTATEVYERLEQEFSSKEQKIFLELNKQIQTNFERMFNAKDKKIELDNSYNIRMLYRNDIAFKEEKNLSEGEKIARNFAFIVTILEYSKNKKLEGNKDSDALPIVLDGPFSKLGAENIHMIANVLPEIAEQVIIFMLEKDWKYTGLDEYVGAKYFIDKDTEKAYASISKGV